MIPISFSEPNEISDNAPDKITITKDEAIALLKECEHSYINYKNSIALQLIRKLQRWVDD